MEQLKFSRTEWFVLGLVTILGTIGFILSFYDHDLFKHHYVQEDGLIEWLTMLGLLCSMVLCGKRVWLLKKDRSLAFVVLWSFLTLFFLFGAGEEISWGQRILQIESSEFFVENNAQGETNFHNLVVGGKKINKLIFGTGFALILLTYLAVLTPLYRKKASAKNWMDYWGIPIPRNYHIIAYVVLLVMVEGVMSSSKRGEMIEFIGSFIVFLNLLNPYNRKIFELENKQEQ